MSYMDRWGGWNAYPGNSLLSGLLAWWKLDEAANVSRADSSGNSQTLTDVNGSVGSASGVIGNAAVFDASTTLLRKSAALFSSGSFSVSLWVNPTDAAATYALFTQSSTGTTRQELSLGVVSKPVWKTGAGAGLVGTVGNHLTTGSWNHVVASYNATTTTQKLYINGLFDGSAVESAVFTGVNRITLGADGGGASILLGSLDLCGVWSRALDDGGVTTGNVAGGEIAALYNSGVGRDFPF